MRRRVRQDSSLLFYSQARIWPSCPETLVSTICTIVFFVEILWPCVQEGIRHHIMAGQGWDLRILHSGTRAAAVRADSICKREGMDGVLKPRLHVREGTIPYHTLSPYHTIPYVRGHGGSSLLPALPLPPIIRILSKVVRNTERALWCHFSILDKKLNFKMFTMGRVNSACQKLITKVYVAEHSAKSMSANSTRISKTCFQKQL